MSTHSRTARSEAKRRPSRGRTLVALVAAAALTLGPGALTAFADDGASSTPEGTSTEVLTAATAPAEQPPVTVPDPVVEPAPAPEPAPEPAPAPDPAPAPEPDPAPAPEPDPVVSDEPAAEDAVTPVEEAVPAEDAGADDALDSSKVAEPTKPKDEERGDNNSHNKISICHATGNDGKWVSLSVDANAIFKQGHDSHQDSRDIIPPFQYKDDGNTKRFPGLNWNETGQATLANGCKTPPPPPEMIPICHATGSDGKWVSLSVDTNAIFKQGHTTHQDGRDIIPPFQYTDKGKVKQYAGLNWDEAGQAFLEAGCVTEMPTPIITVTVDQCVAPTYEVPGMVMIMLSSLKPGQEYVVTVTGPASFEESHAFTATGTEYSFNQAIAGAGNYVAEVVSQMMPTLREGSNPDWQVWASVAFTVNPDCKPVVPPAPPAPPAAVVQSVVHPVVQPVAMKTTPALATTGASEQGTGFAGILLLVAGSALLLTTGARRMMNARGNK